jgi:threonine synthase
MNRWHGVIEEYRKFLPVTDRTPVVTIGEGNTPLIRATRLAKLIAPGIDLHLKFEGMNPTGSFKDRGMTMAISKAVESGAKAVICASTGNTSASAAAYGARAGLAVYVLIPAGKIAMGKLSQAMMHQATVIQIEGNFDQALTIVKELSVTYHIELVNSINPYRIEGQKTAAMEVCDQQHYRLLEGISGIPCGQSIHATASHDRISGGWCRAHCAWPHRGEPTDGGHGDPNR